MNFSKDFYCYETYEQMRENHKLILEQIRETKRVNRLNEDAINERII